MNKDKFNLTRLSPNGVPSPPKMYTLPPRMAVVARKWMC